jgi:hypothetical protein
VPPEAVGVQRVKVPEAVAYPRGAPPEVVQNRSARLRVLPPAAVEAEPLRAALRPEVRLRGAALRPVGLAGQEAAWLRAGAACPAWVAV